MPNHTPEHIRKLASASASHRRAAKSARLINTAPPMDGKLVTQLCALLNARVADGGAR